MTTKEAIDVLERSCDFHYEETDKCYGCLFENSGWCGEDFHENLLALLKEQDRLIAEARNEGYNEAYRSYCVEVAEEDEETLRYAVEQDLEVAGFDVDVALLKEPDAVHVELEGGGSSWWHVCGECRSTVETNDKYCHECGRRLLF